MNQNIHTQKGYSLVEIMIALVMSMVLMAGVLQIFLSGKRAYRLETGFSEIQDGSRFLSSHIANVIRMSGYRTPPVDANFNEINAIYEAGTPYISAQNDNGQNNSDIITIRYQGSGDGLGNPDGTIRDCLNQPIDANVMATNILSITLNNELQCQALNPSAATVNRTEVLIPGVENIQVLFGEDTSDDGNPNRYVTPDFATLVAENIVSARIGYVLASQDEVNSKPDSSTYNILGTAFAAPGDYRIRKNFSFTVLLRNVTAKK